MATERQRQIALGAVLLVLAVVVYRAVTSFGSPSEGAATPSNTRAQQTRGGGAAAPTTAPDVHLQALDEDRPKPVDGQRNLFRFKPKAAPPPPRQGPPAVVRSGPVVPPGPSGPPPPPPIPLKFIGIVEAPSQAKRLAALVDPAGRSYHGAEGEIVAGQYRILKIGVESIELVYLDGRGRQTIRLSGS
jgi:hypothetical protein